MAAMLFDDETFDSVARNLCARVRPTKTFQCVLLVICAALLVTLFVYPGAKTADVSPCRQQPICRCVCNAGDRPATNTSCATGLPCSYADDVDLRVVVLTFNRPDSLSIVLRSLDALVLDGDRAALEIWIDRDPDGGVDERTLEVASKFSWLGGVTRAHVQVALPRCFSLQSFLRNKY